MGRTLVARTGLLWEHGMNRFKSSSNFSHFPIRYVKNHQRALQEEDPHGYVGEITMNHQKIRKKKKTWQVLKQIYCRWRPEESCTFKATRLGLDGHGLRSPTVFSSLGLVLDSLESPCSFPQKRIELPWSLSIYHSQKGYDRTVIDHSSNSFYCHWPLFSEVLKRRLFSEVSYTRPMDEVVSHCVFLALHIMHTLL